MAKHRQVKSVRSEKHRGTQGDDAPDVVRYSGRALDNIFTERLWRSVKYEEVYLNDYDSPRAARLGLSRYLTFYNQERLHQALGYKTPAAIYHLRLQACSN